LSKFDAALSRSVPQAIRSEWSTGLENLFPDAIMVCNLSDIIFAADGIALQQPKGRGDLYKSSSATRLETRKQLLIGNDWENWDV